HDKVVITFNYKEGEETITFADLKAVIAERKNGSDSDCSTAPELDTSFDTMEYQSRCPVSFLKNTSGPMERERAASPVEIVFFTEDEKRRAKRYFLRDGRIFSSPSNRRFCKIFAKFSKYSEKVPKKDIKIQNFFRLSCYIYDIISIYAAA
ncbi:MAG: hypothetical protein LUF77_00155, partial [Oscillospiraceae bacterium]|nr:hypothetical protein [Oscillospiraceae bacterium]